MQTIQKRLCGLWLGLAVGLAIACGAPPKPTKETSNPPAAGPAKEKTDAVEAPAPGSDQAIAADDEAPVSAEEAKAEADKRWKTAEREDDEVSWEAAALALALAGKIETQSDLSKPLLRGALAAWHNADKKRSVAVSVPSGDRDAGRTKRALRGREVARLATLQKLASLLPANDSEQSMVAYRRGRIYYNFGHYSEAVTHFTRLVEHFPSSEQAEYAAPLLLDSLVADEKFDELLAVAAKMLASRNLIASHPDLEVTLLRIRWQGDTKKAEALAQSSEFAACAAAYLRIFRRDDRRGEGRDTALYNASVCLEKGGQIKEAIQVLRKLVRFFPDSGFATKAKERAEALSARL